MPSCFKESYPNTFAIIDATELRCQVPLSLSLQSQMYSSYKSHTTYKGLVGIAPNGAFIFVSQLFTGSISDRELTERSSILNLLQYVPAGKSIMADRGFDIQDLLAKYDILTSLPSATLQQLIWTREQLLPHKRLQECESTSNELLVRLRSDTIYLME